MKVLFATGNMGKLKEVKSKFEAHGIEVVHLDDRYPELQVDTLEEVVEWGLDWLWKRHKKPLMIDDSGLFIDSLKGYPGVYSAYVFKTLGCEGILNLLEGKKDRSAEFRCCAGYIDSKGEKTLVAGKVKGKIITEKKGTGGFGYDPIFVPDGHEKTFAQMSTDEKNSISHRGRAFDLLAGKIKTLNKQ
jgi:XTP/dITP diphosphohydrolase